MLHIANPIYDTVFKYLMEDERIVKTILSALLKKEVIEAEMRKHEYTNGQRDKISMFRIDFGAKIREDDGSVHLVLIELQKTWLETETLRFRQYLGAQYANPDNMIKEDNPMGYGLPMITVYLLGHKVGDIEEPVLYVSHKPYDYYGNLVTKGIPDPFVESLVHDSIIVQIPRLHGNINNRLAEVLSVFDQTRKDKYNRQVMNINEADYAEDEDMMRIVHRLVAAAADSKLRQDMNVEDEYFLAIENRDTAIMQRDKRIEKQDKKIEEQGKEIERQDIKIKELDQDLEQKEKALEQKNKDLEQKNKDLEQKNKDIEQKNKDIEQKNKDIEQKNKDIEQKNKDIEQKNNTILNAARHLKEQGMSVEQISAIMNLEINVIEQL